MRYSTISPYSHLGKTGKFRSLVEVSENKQKLNTTLTQYKGIGEIKKIQEKYQSMKNHRRAYHYER
jgi:hypothetical protein